MLQPRKNLLDKISEIEYLEIPIDRDSILTDQEIIIRYSKSYSLQAAMLFLVLNTIGVYTYFKSPDFIHQHPFLSFAIAAFMLAGLITFLVQLYKNKIILRLTIEAFEYKNNRILWGTVRNMYVRKQSVEHGFSHDLVIEVKKGDKFTFPLEDLDQDYEIILFKLGKFYGNHLRTEQN